MTIIFITVSIAISQWKMARKSGGRQSGYYKRFLEVGYEECEGETSREVLRGSDVYEVERLVEKRVKKSGKKVSSVSRGIDAQ